MNTVSDKNGECGGHEPAKAFAMRALHQLGFQVKPITVCPTKGRRADLEVHDDQFKYVIEVKQRFDDADQVEADRKRLLSGEIVTSSDPHSYCSAIKNILKDGREQVDATPDASTAFRLLWLHADGWDAEHKVRRARNTFYGLVPLLPVQSSRREAVHCFYFDYNVSHNIPSIHGLFISDSKGLELCVNEFAVNASEFRGTPLVAALRRHDAVIDPSKLEEDSNVVVLRSAVPRRNEEVVLEEVFRLTGRRFVSVRFDHHTFEAFVPFEE